MKRKNWLRCQLVDISGKHEWLDGGHLQFRESSMFIKMWVATITRIIQCREAAHPSNGYNFSYYDYYLNLSQIDLSSLLITDKVGVEYDMWYYGTKFELIGRGEGSLETWNVGDQHSLSTTPRDPYQSYYSMLLLVFAVRLGVSYTFMMLVAFVLHTVLRR